MPARRMKSSFRGGSATICLSAAHLAATVALCALMTQSVSAFGGRWQGNFIITGTVSLPDGNPAARISVRISGPTGLNFETTTDNSGRYTFQVPGGRYRLSATNPQNKEQYMDPVEADTSRTAGNRLIVPLYLRTATKRGSRDPKPAVVSVAEASEHVPDEARKAYQQGLKQKTHNQPEKALASFDRAIEIYPDYFQALAERGELRISGARIDQALADFGLALKLNKDYGPALRGAGYCKLERQQFAEAADYFERASSIEPGIANTYLFLGIADLALDRREPARQALLHALKIDAERAVTAHVYLADLFARENRYKDAADELRAYLRARPDAPDAQRLKAKEAELRALSKQR